MARGAYPHLVTVQNPGAPVPDGDGGYTQTWTDGTPATWHVSIVPATQADLERLAAGTVISSASHVVRGDFRPDVTTLTRLTLGAQVFAITGTVNVDLRSVDMLCGAVEVVQ
jgi:head-tail adaptor